MKFRPIGARLLVLPDEPETMSPGGIVLPDAAQANSKLGTVVAVGKGQRNENGDYSKPEAKVGDRVLFTSYGTEGIEVDGKDHLLLREVDILAVVEPC